MGSSNLTYMTWTIGTVAVAIIACIAALLIYQRSFPLKRFVAPFLLSLCMVVSAWVQVSASYEYVEVTEENAIETYVLADVIQQDETGSSAYLTKQAWEENPTSTHTLLLAYAFIKNEQLDRGSKLLDELLTYNVEKEAIVGVPVEDIQELYDDVQSIMEDQTEPFREAVDEGTRTSWNRLMDGQLDALQDKIAADASLGRYDIDLVALAHMDRLQLLVADQNEEELAEVEQDIREILSDEEEQLDDMEPHVQHVVAQSLLFFGHEEEAEQLLIQLIIKSPTDHEAITLLSELYGQEGYHPAEEAKQLPQFTHAHILVVHEKMNGIVEWVESDTYEEERFEIELVEDEAHEEESEDPLPAHILSDEELQANELTYALVQSSPNNGEDANLSVRLARYHFNKGSNEQAREAVREMLDESESLTSNEQLLINTIQHNHQQLSDTQETEAFAQRQHYLEEIYQAKEKIYTNFHTPKRHEQRTISDESFEYFLTESIRNSDGKDVSIMSVDATDEGLVSMYVHAYNMDLSDKSKASITDQWEDIPDFTMEKIGENTTSSSVDRSIGMVIDVSGSMEGERIDIARTSSASFIQGMKDFEQIELVSFESHPTLVEPFTQNKEQLIQGVRTLESDGGTNITDALLFEIDRIKDAAGQKVIFIFSDGEDDVFSKVESRSQVIDLANAHGITIFAVGFGAGYETLSEVATETGGMYIAAPNASTIDDGFKQIEDILSSTYKITYELDQPDLGKRLAQFTYDAYTDEKYYVLGNVDKYIDAEQDAPSFDLFQSVPFTVYQSNSDDILVTLRGVGLHDVTKISLGQMDVTSYEIINDQTIELRVPGDISLGKQIIYAVNEDGQRVSTTLQVTAVGMQNEVQLGYATLYADQCQRQMNQIDCQGDLSIDHFMYPEGSTMTVVDDEYVTFNGLKFQIEESKLLFFKHTLGQNRSHLTGKMVMKIEDEYGENFSLTYEGRNQLSVNKIGFALDLDKMNYQAVPERAPGEFTAESSFSTLPTDVKDALNIEEITILEKIVPFITAKAALELTISPTEANIKGSTNFKDLTLIGIEFKSPFGMVEYDDLNKRLAVEGTVEGFSIFKKQVKALEAKRPGLSLDGFDYMVGLELPFKPAFGLTVNGSFPLGTTGATIDKVGASIDFTSRREGTFVVGFGTVLDGPIEMIVSGLNEMKIGPKKIFDIDVDSLLSLEIDGKVSEAFIPSWSAEGGMEASILGFTVAEARGLVNHSMVDVTMNTPLLEGNGRMTFSHPDYGNRLTFQTMATFNPSWIDQIHAELHFRLIPSAINQSEVKVIGTVAEFPFALSTDDLQIFK